MRHVGGKLTGVGQRFVAAELFLHVALVGHVVHGAKSTQLAALTALQTPCAQLVVAQTPRALAQRQRRGQHVAAAQHVVKMGVEREPLLVARVAAAQHDLGAAVAEDTLARAVVHGHAQRQVFHDALVERFHPAQFVGVAAHTLEHALKRLGQLPHLVAAVGVQPAQLARAARRGADLSALAAQLADGT